MNESASRLLALLPLLVALLIGGCRADTQAPPLEGATMGGDFSLTNQEGRRVSQSDFAGQYRIVYFGFASCPDVCPVDLQTIGAGLRQFESEHPDRAAKVQPIFISVDPARDTPEVLREYVANFHPRLVGLTGTPEELAQVARRYGVYYRIGDPAEGADPQSYLVDHSRLVVLYGPAGEPIAILPHDQGPAGFAAELERWVE